MLHISIMESFSDNPYLNRFYQHLIQNLFKYLIQQNLIRNIHN